MGEQINSGRMTIGLERQGDTDVVTLSGQLDEQTGLGVLADRLGRTVLFDLEGLSFMNSVGLRDWIRLLAGLCNRGTAVTLRRCSESMVNQMNMIVAARASAAIESFFAPYQCPACSNMVSLLLPVAPNLDRFRMMETPAAPCDQCGAAMELAAIPESYLLFLES